MEYILIFITAIFVNNIVLSQFLYSYICEQHRVVTVPWYLPVPGSIKES